MTTAIKREAKIVKFYFRWSSLFSIATKSTKPTLNGRRVIAINEILYYSKSLKHGLNQVGPFYDSVFN